MVRRNPWIDIENKRAHEVGEERYHVQHMKIIFVRDGRGSTYVMLFNE